VPARAQVREEPIPLVFAHTRRTLSRTLRRSLKSSVVAILNYDGANTEFKEMVALAKERQLQWKEWTRLPAQQEAARAHEERLRAEMGDEAFAQRMRMQRLCFDDAVLLPVRSLVLEPKRPAVKLPRQPAQASDAAAGTQSQTTRRHVDPVQVSLGLIGR
jgi:hypothetical protein